MAVMLMILLIFKWHSERIHIFVSSFTKKLFKRTNGFGTVIKLNIIWSHLHAGLGYTAGSMPCFSTYSFEKEKITSRFSLLSNILVFLSWWLSSLVDVAEMCEDYFDSIWSLSSISQWTGSYKCGAFTNFLLLKAETLLVVV